MYDVIIGRGPKDVELFGKKGAVFIGKQYVKMGQVTSLSNDIYMDVTRSHVVFVCGKRGSGKSYSMGVIAEGISDLPSEVSENIAVVLLDTMGIYWTMKYPNKQDEKLLDEWKLKPKAIDVKIFTPVGYYKQYKADGIPTDFPFSIKPSELDIVDWHLTFGIPQNDPIGVFIERIINDLKERGRDYSIAEIIDTIRADEKTPQLIKDAAENRFLNAQSWGLFDVEGTKIDSLVRAGQVSVLDVSCYATIPGAAPLRALVIGLVAQKLFIKRMVAKKLEEYRDVHQSVHYFGEDDESGKKEMPVVWLVIDECLPGSSKIQTELGIRRLCNVVNDFSKGKKIRVVGYNRDTKCYGIYSVTKCYKRPKKEIITVITETGQSIRCTSNHKIYSSNGFVEANNSEDIAVPLIKQSSINKKHIEARLLGAIFGDGWLSSNGKSIGFSGKGNNQDLERIKKDLKLLGFKSSSIHSVETRSSITSQKGRTSDVKGLSQSITSSSYAFQHFRKLGAPIGTKVLLPFTVPAWIKNGSANIKCEFLAGLMGADGCTISKNINIQSDFNPIRISFNKIESLEKQAGIYANELKRLFEDVGIKISNIVNLQGNLRKDGHKTIKIQITIAKSIDNTIKFLETAGYRYCEKKEITGEKWLHYLRVRKRIMKERQKLRNRAVELHKEKGLGKIKIGRMLNIPEYVVREWIYYGKNAGVQKNFCSFDEWINKRASGNNLFLKIIKKNKTKKEVVYDLSVDEVNNFVADGFLVHNCHEFLPKDEVTPASNALITILREGRQPGISLILASQQPGKIHTDVMTQSDIVIAHRITAKIDTDALGALMQSYMREGLDKQLDNLPRVTGSALIFDDVNERLYPVKIRPRFTWHGGSAPSAIHEKKNLFEL